jgi:NAD+ synthase
MKEIKLAKMNPELVANEIGKFILDVTKRVKATGGVVGLSGGVDSTTVAALAARAYKNTNYELVGYILPTKINKIDDKNDAIKVARRLEIRYEIQNIETILEAHKTTNFEAFNNSYDRGNLISRIRANVLNTKAATERKTLLGTGNRDEDFGVGYYTLFGDGAVHSSPIGNLTKRMVREMACYLGFEDLAYRIPTAGLEVGQTDFKDLGYSYDLVELVSEGLKQGFNEKQIKKHFQVLALAEKENDDYIKLFGKPKFEKYVDSIDDLIYRHNYIALPKAEIISPRIAEVTLSYV